MPNKVLTRVSPSLDPDTYREMEGLNDETVKFVGGVINAFNDAYATLGKLWDARDLADSNPGWTKEQRVLHVGREATKHMERVRKRFELAYNDLSATIAHTEGELSRPLTQRAGAGTLNDAVRDHAKGLDRPKREAFMREAFEQGDELTLEAVLGAPYYLSGFTKVDHDHYVRTYHERKNPHLVKRLDVMNRFRDVLDRTPPIVKTQFEKVIGAPPRDAEVIRVAHDRATAALKIEPTA